MDFDQICWRRGGARNKWLDFGDVLADPDNARLKRVLAHAPATAPLGGGLRSPSASSSVLFLHVYVDIYGVLFSLFVVL